MQITRQFPLWLAAATPAVTAFAPRGLAAMLAAFTLMLVISVAICAFRDGVDWKTRLQPIKYKSLTLCTLALALLAVSATWSDSPRAYEMLRDVAYISISAFLVYHLSRGWTIRETLELHRVLAAWFFGFLILFTANVLADFPLQKLFNDIPPDADSLLVTNVPKRSSAVFVLLMWPVAFGFFLRGHKREAYATLLLTSVLSLLYNSTTAMIGSFAGLAVLLLGQWRVRLAQSIGLAALPLGFVLMIVLSLSIPNLPKDFSEHVKDTGDYRLMIWNFVGRHTLDHLPFGIGIDGSRVLSSDGETVPYNKGDILPDHPHNVYLQIWLELGIPGVIIAMLLTGLLWRRIYYAPRRIQPFIWGYVVTASITLAIAYGTWQAWWLAAHGLTAIYMAAIARTYSEEA